MGEGAVIYWALRFTSLGAAVVLVYGWVLERLLGWWL